MQSRIQILNTFIRVLKFGSVLTIKVPFHTFIFPFPMPSKETFSDILALPHVSESVQSLKIESVTPEVLNILLDKIRLCISEDSGEEKSNTQHSCWHQLMSLAESHNVPLKLVDKILGETRDSIRFALKVSLEIETIQWLVSIERITHFFHAHVLSNRYKYLRDHPEVLQVLEMFVKKVQRTLHVNADEIDTAEKLLRSLLKKEANTLPTLFLKRYYEQLGKIIPEPECIKKSFQEVPNLEVFQIFAELFFTLYYELRDVHRTCSFETEIIDYLEEISSFAEIHGEKFVQQRNVLMTLYSKS